MLTEEGETVNVGVVFEGLVTVIVDDPAAVV
jgi:hypothetical protein